MAASLKSCETTLALAENYNFIYGAIGVHPSETAELDENGMERLEHWCGCKKIRAVGEIGLDYYWEEPDHEIQKKWFVRQLDLARRSRLPVISTAGCGQGYSGYHESRGAGEIGGVIHCFPTQRRWPESI